MGRSSTLFSNSTWGVTTQILRSLMGIAFVPLVITQIGTLNYGVFSSLMLLTYAQGFFNQTDLGYLGFLLKNTSKFKEAEAMAEFEHQSQGFAFIWIITQVIASAVLLLALNLLCGWFGVPEDQIQNFRLGVVLVCLSNFISCAGSMNSHFLMSQHQNALVKKGETFFYFVFVILSLIGFQFEKSLRVLVIAFVLSQTFQSLYFVGVVKKQFGRFLRLDFKMTNRFMLNWKAWRPFLFSKLNGLAIRQTDTAFVLFLGGPEQVAFYEISMKFPSFLKVLLGRVSEAFVAFSGANQTEEAQMRIGRILSNLIFFQAAAALAFVFATLFYGETILSSWLGTSIEPKLILGLQLSSLIPLVMAFCSAPGALLLGRDKRANFMAVVPTLLSVGNIILSLPATYFFGFLGTVVCTVLQFLGLGLVLLKPSQVDFGIQPSQIVKKLSFCVPLIILSQLGISKVLALVETRITTIFAMFLLNLLFVVFLGVVFKTDLLRLRREMAVKAAS